MSFRDLKHILRRYKKYSEQFERECGRLDRWAMLMPIGQPFPSYQRASLKHAYFKQKKLTPLWLKIRNRITVDKKTLWQFFPHTTAFDPPLYREIKPFLQEKLKRHYRK